MKYTVIAATADGCDCEDCRADRHIYSLYRWSAEEWRFAAISLQAYASAEECRRRHYWGLEFKPDDTWEDGTPIVEPDLAPSAELQSGTGGLVKLNTKALAKAAEALEKHWRQP